MKIIKISRKVTGDRYDNIGLEAEVAEDDDLVDVANHLDQMCHNLLKDIYKKRNEINDKENKKSQLEFKLTKFLKMIEGSTPDEVSRILRENELPF